MPDSLDVTDAADPTPHAPVVEPLTRRLRLRRPVEADRAFFDEVHSDPRLYTHAPHVIGTPESNAALFASILRHWDDDGFGYWLVEDRESGEPFGVGGISRREGMHNLYYRLAASAQGRGIATEVARAAVAMATEWFPDEPVQALIKEHNAASVRTAESAGLVRNGDTVVLPDDLADEPASTVFEAPRAETVTAFDTATRERVIGLWCAVNAAGGSVGFVGDAPREQVSSALGRHEESMAAGDGAATVLRDPDGSVVGLGFALKPGHHLFPHVVDLWRVMVDPTRRGRSLGVLLVAGLHRAARSVEGAELLRLDYRSGSGLGDFYAQCGYVETGRAPGTIRVAPGDDRDDVQMMRRLDGALLVGDGRH